MSSTIEVRACTSDDVFALAIVGAATFLDAFAELIPGEALLAHCRKNHHAGAYSAALAKPETRAWLAEVLPGRGPVGYAMLTAPEFPPRLARSGDLELRRIYLLSRFHGTGTGPRMMQCAVAEARAQGAERLLLGVHPDNRRALAFYRKNGFVQVGTRQFQVGSSVFHDPVLALTL